MIAHRVAGIHAGLVPAVVAEMCDACEDWDAREPRQAGLHPGLLRLARRLERGMPGTPLPDAAWRIALGEDSGAITWQAHLRILAAFEAARTQHAASGAFATRRRGGRLACDAAEPQRTPAPTAS